jgi:uncharacterized protein YoxC
MPAVVIQVSDKIINIDKTEAEKGAEKKPGQGAAFSDGDSMDRFVSVFEASARRWELIVYPAMLAFVVLAAYGFFLIYTLSKDIHTLAQGMDPEMGKHLSHISQSVIYLSENVRTMTRRVYHMSESVEEMSGKMDSLDNLDPMLVSMRGMNDSMYNMNHSMQLMTLNTDVMRHEMGNMGDSMRPMGRLNSFMPW